MPYVSVTGLRVKSIWRVPHFWWHAFAAMRQAKQAPGNLFADARRIEGVQHTLSVWRSREDMRAYMTTGAHLAAMKDFRRIATGSTCGFEAEHPPTWDEAITYWRVHGQAYSTSR
ncbi:MAG: hypothetical protein Q8M31_06015 [Beijerinckiaceae bacterium]|nr:hypothetical protein [Beijerinckiaceae bacterium]